MGSETHVWFVQTVIVKVVDRHRQVVSRVEQAGVCIGGGGNVSLDAAVLFLQRSIACSDSCKLTDREGGPEAVGTGCKSQGPADGGLDIGLLAGHLGRFKNRENNRQTSSSNSNALHCTWSKSK